MIDRYPRLSPSRERVLKQMNPAIRGRVEAAALELFSEREFYRVKLINIARAARISLQTLYKYYGNKETVLFASLETCLGALASRMVDHLQGIENFQDRLHKLFWLLLEYCGGNPKIVQLTRSSAYLNAWRTDDSFRQTALTVVFLGVIREGRARGLLTCIIDDIETTDFIFGVTNRAVAMWLLRGNRGPLTDKTPALFAMIWRAIASDAALASALKPSLTRQVQATAG